MISLIKQSLRLIDILLPVLENPGRLAVTITAATFFVFKFSPLVFIPNFSNKFTSPLWVKFEFLKLSSVPSNPVTKPYPTKTLSLMRSKLTISLILESEFDFIGKSIRIQKTIESNLINLYYIKF